MLVQNIKRLDGCTSKSCSKKGKSKNKTEPRLNLDTLELDPQEVEEDQREVNWDDSSSTLNVEDTEERRQLWNDADTRKAAKVERKVAKRQVRFDVVTKEDLDKIQNALHPAEVKNLTNEAARAPNGQGLIDNGYVFWCLSS